MTVQVAYDPMGNRSSYAETYTGGVASLSKSYAYSPANEMLNDGGVSQTFDNNGNLVNRGGVAYTWDARNRLTGVGSGWSAVYDYENRLATKNGTDYIYDDKGWLWSEVNATSGVPKNIYSYDQIGLIGQATIWGNVSGPLQQTYFLFDGLGSMQEVTDQTNKTIATYSTDAFGVGSSYSNYDTPFMYTGRWGGMTDSKVGVLNWNRWYLPEQSRWGSRDPIETLGGFNEYGYVENSSTTNFDALGLCKTPGDCYQDANNAMLQALIPDPRELAHMTAAMLENLYGILKVLQGAALSYPNKSSIYRNLGLLEEGFGNLAQALEATNNGLLGIQMDKIWKNLEDCLKNSGYQA